MAEIVDTPADLYENPRNLFVAGFIGSPSMNFLPGRLEGEVVKTPIGDIPLSEPYVYFDVKTDQEIHTADLDELAADAALEDLLSHGGGQQVVARLSAESKASPGREVELSVDTSQIKLFDAGTGRSLTTA